MTHKKPFAPSADRNRHPILEALREELSHHELVLEIGSGTGQHVCHFAAQLPFVRWQPTDRAVNLPGIRQWTAECNCSNILPALELELGGSSPEIKGVTSCYSANTLHIISWVQVEALFALANRLLPENGKLIVYGPFLFDGDFGSDGNRQFDRHLRDSDPLSGLRDARDLDRLAKLNDFAAARVRTMPSNNHLLIWHR